MKIKVNGVTREIANGATLHDVVSMVATHRRGVAVSLDREVVPRSAWGATTMHDGATVEILTAAAGG